MAAPVPSPDDWFDWEGDRPLNIPLDQLIIYELHVRGFTRHPSAQASAPGTSSTTAHKEHADVNSVSMPNYVAECNMRICPNLMLSDQQLSWLQACCVSHYINVKHLKKSCTSCVMLCQSANLTAIA